MPVAHSLAGAIAEFVDSVLPDRPAGVRGPKMIHDAIHGSLLFEEHEVALLDLPLLQRLRRVNQLDVVTLVFPSANHNRFEHTLGVTAVADRLARSLQRRAPELVDEDDLRHVRAAAILHDCGHSCFSHLSEEIYGSSADFESLKDEPYSQGKKPHEIVSHLIVVSEPFKRFLVEIQAAFGVTLDADRIGDMILGKPAGKAYLADIVHGAADADKLDYIQRDSHFTGIRMAIDLDRLFHTLSVADVEGQSRLSTDITGVSVLEQITFNKMMLTSTVYHHHKVRSAECLVRAIFEVMRKVKPGKFERAPDFLQVTDYEIYAFREEFPEIRRLVDRLTHRDLFKRALVISPRTVDPDCEPQLASLLALAEDPVSLQQVRQEIHSVLQASVGSKGPDPEEVWIDVPQPPVFQEAAQWPVRTEGGSPLRLREIFPIDEWAKAFAQNKYKAHVFCPPQYRTAVYEAATQVLQKRYDLRFTTAAWDQCKAEGDRS